MKRLKIPTKSGKYYKGLWLELYDGGSGQWLYACCDILTYIFIEVTDLVDACGKDATERWVASVSVVDLIEATPKTMAEAIQYCGYVGEIDFKKSEDRLQLAEMLFSAGAKAPMWEKCGGKVTEDNLYDSPGETHPAFRTLRSQAHLYAKAELFNEDHRNELLDSKVVNKVGQTAREFAAGSEGLWTALRRIKKMGVEATPEQQIILKMYRGAGQTLGAGPVPKDIMEET